MISVLYVDDEPGMREVAQTFLEDAGGFEFTALASAKKALESPDILSYDAIVSDYMMPGMDGIAFLKAVRQRSADIPFILFTGRGREQVVIEAINNSADFYLQKGGDPDAQFAELAHKIRQAVRRRMAEHDRIQSEEKFSRLFMANPSLEAISDFNTGNLIEINDAFIRTTGYSREDLIGKTTRDIGLFIDYTDRERMVQIITNGNILQNFETKIRTKSGDIRTLDFTGQRVRAGNTDILFTQAVDITDRKRLERDLEREHMELQASYEQITAAEEELREQYEELARSEREVRTNEERLIMAQKIGHTGSWEYNLVTNEIWGSAEGLNIFGFHRGAGNFPIDEIEACIQEPYRKQVHQALVDLLTKGQEYDLEYTISPADGSAQRTIHSLARLEKDASGKSLRVIGVLQDITDRKKAEEALKKSEEKYRLLTENTYDIIYSADLEGRITHVSPHIARYGYTPEQLISLRISDVIDEEDLPEVQVDMQTTLATGKPTRTVFRLKSSSKKPVWFEDNGTVMKNADGVIVGISGVLRDITERKKAEEALRDSEAKLRRLADNAPDMIYRMILPEGKYEYVSPASLAMTGFTPEEFYADPGLIRRLIHPDWHEYFRQQWDALLEKKAPPFYEYQIIDRAGTTRWFNQRNMLVSDEQGNPVSIEGIVTDITRQKKTERELRRSELRSLAVSENAGSWIWEVDPDGVYRYSSPAVNRILGYRPDELVGKLHFYDLFDPAVRESLKAAALTAFSSHEPFQNFVNLNRHKNGTPVLMSTSGTPVFDEDGTFTGYCGVDEDITERKRAEEALRQAHKKLHLLSGITRHDISNQLLALNGFVSILHKKVTDPALEPYFTRITKATTQINTMIAFTKEYEKIGLHAPVWQVLATVLDNAGKGILPGQVTLKNDLPAGTEVYADPLIVNVFFNLLDNSVRHGMRVTEIRVSALRSGEDLVVVWEDNGIGIEQEEKELIFEKGFGKNTGLGMFLAREILSLTGITITETGQPGVGARFEMVVPKGVWRRETGDA